MSPGEVPVASGQVQIAAATVPGAAHLRRGRPNQDAVGWLPASGKGKRLVMAVSDGHGGTASPRSHLGSRLAVDVATRLLWQLPTHLTEQILQDAVQQISHAWRREVQEHLNRHPLSSAEIEQGALEPASDTLARLQEHPTLAYGATLLFAIIGAQQIGLGQLGDGDILLVPNSGDTHRPLPPDARLLAHTTTSLCDNDPVGSTRLAVHPRDSRLVILSTDGYANSFTDDASFLQVGTDLLATVNTAGIARVRQSLPTWLAETSQQGAGDDIGVAIALIATSGAHPEPSSPTRASRPAIKPVQVHPVRPAEPPGTHPVPEETAGPSQQPIVRRTATWPAAVGSLIANPPLRDWRHGKNEGASRPRPTSGQRSAGPRGVIIAAVGLAAVLGLGTGGYALIDNHGREQPLARSSNSVSSQPAGTSAPVTVSWTVSDDRLAVLRRAGSTVTKLPLPSPVTKLLPVPGGALLLLANGQVGLLPGVGALIIDDWPTVQASDLVRQRSSYYLLDNSRSQRWVIDPCTGAVTLLTSDKGPPPFSPSITPRPVPTTSESYEARPRPGEPVSWRHAPCEPSE